MKHSFDFILGKNLDTPNRFALVFMFSAIFLLMTSPFTIDEAYGSHLSVELKWQLVFISSNPACDGYQYQMMSKYTEITELYFENYELENSKYDSLCFPEKKYLQESPLDLDLIILVYDEDLGREELHSQKMGGFYNHVGKDITQNHVIVFCDCSNFYYSDPVWILSHELSHFALTFLEIDLSVVEDLVHINDEKYDQCRDSYDDDCASIVKKLRSDTAAYYYSVMPIYKPALVIDVVQTPEEIPTAVVEISKVITKWWTQGTISDAQYSNALGFMAAGNDLYSNMQSEIMMADHAIDDEVTWVELLSADTDEEAYDLLSRVPSNFMSNEKRIYGQDEMEGMAFWVKETATWWIEGKITDEEFVETVSFLRNEGIIRPR